MINQLCLTMYHVIGCIVILPHTHNGLASNSLCLWPYKMGGFPWSFWHEMYLIPFVNRDTKSAPKFGSVTTWVTSCLPLSFCIWMVFCHPITKLLKPFIGRCARQLQNNKELMCCYPNASQQPQNITSSWMLRSKSKIPPNICIFQIKEQGLGGGPDWKTKERRNLQGEVADGPPGGPWQSIELAKLTGGPGNF